MSLYYAKNIEDYGSALLASYFSSSSSFVWM